MLALGANTCVNWGKPVDALARAVRELSAAGVKVTQASTIYSTAPVGGGRQARYLNAVIRAEPGVAPTALLRLAKRLERLAGRRLGRYHGPRPLDIDLLQYGGLRFGWPPHRQHNPGRLIVPHPEMHRRAFVLVPLLEIAPAWRHPVFGMPGRALLARLTPKARADVAQSLDFEALPCEKSRQ